jgi:hypothetical protein
MRRAHYLAPAKARSVPRLKIAPSRTRRLLAAGLLLTLFGGGSDAQPALQRWRCTNAASGAHWTIVLDADRSRVDRFPATFTDRVISWRDPDRGFYDLNRASGDLQLRNASSTGGYFLHYRCRPE